MRNIIILIGGIFLILGGGLYVLNLKHDFVYKIRRSYIKIDNSLYKNLNALRKDIIANQQAPLEHTAKKRHIYLPLLPEEKCRSFLNDKEYRQMLKSVDSKAQKKIRTIGTLCGRGGYCKAADQCGDIVGVDCNSGGDGPYYFVNIKTIQSIGNCSFWSGRCKPPLEWRCDPPANYRG